MKRKLLLFFIVALLPMVASAYDAKINGIYYNFSGNNAAVTYGQSTQNSYSGNVVIPKTVTYNNKTYSVTSIGDDAFSSCSNLTSITIGQRVTSIGDDAFLFCSSLTSITIPNSVTSIGDGAFYGCSSLTSITIPNSVTKIDSNAFADCSSLVSITIPNSVTSISDGAFADCSSLVSITIPNNVTSIGSAAFENCSSLTSVTIPNRVTSIGIYAFYRCSSLISITIPDGVTSIGNFAFFCCSSLSSIIIPNSVEIICEYAFNGCSSLTSIIIPDSVTSIGKGAFHGCSGLTSVTIPESVTSIGKGAFHGCSGLTSVTIPESVTSIGDDAFSSCSNLTSITIGQRVTSIGKNAFDGCSSLTSITIPSSVTRIGESAFEGCSSLIAVNIKDLASWCNISFSNQHSNPLYYAHHFYMNGKEIKDLVVPEGVTSIGGSVFCGCSSLTSVSIPNSVTSIGSSVFSGCNNLTSVILESNAIVSASRTSSTSIKSIFGNQVKTYILGASISDIGSYAFYGCSSLTTITIPNSVTSIGNYVFYGCSSLKSVTIPNCVTSIGNYVFYGCSSLKSVTIPNNVMSIGECAFQDCSSMISISLPESVTSIGQLAFSGCGGLTSVTIPNSVINIGMNAFSGCSKLVKIILESNAIVSASRTSSTSLKSIFGEQIKKYILGASISVIGSYAFSGCSGLTSVTIPNNVTRIGDEAFYNCSALISITIPNSVTSIGSSAFSGCSSLTSVTIGSGVTSIGNNAFYGCNAKLYATQGTDGLLSVWNYGTDPYKTGTTEKLLRPSVSATSSTQTTVTYCIDNIYPELEYDIAGEPLGENTYLIKGIRPGCEQSIDLTVHSANNSFRTTTNATTLPISPTVVSKNITASSLSVEGNYIKGDAKVISTLLTMDGREMTNNKGYLHGLKPNTSYNCKYMVVVEYGDGETYPYEGSLYIYTAGLNLSTQQPKVISTGNVIVSAQSNLDDEETNVGFEWRRIDWTDDFASNTGVAYLYEGTMEGYIRNLYVEKLWKYRPYYQSDSGNRYYGDWVGIDPTNTSYFGPTVHTYAYINVTGNRAEVKGYAMRGTDRVTSQGFMCWKSSSSYSLRKKAPSIPSDAVTVEASDNVMTAVFENLEYETQYCYVAFVKTEENETFFGEVQTFSTNVDPDGIKDIEHSPLNIEETWYSLDGKKLSKPQKGINIIRYSDGTSKKVLVK